MPYHVFVDYEELICYSEGLLLKQNNGLAI